MKTLSEFKKEMREYFYTTVDAEDDETFKDWFGALYDALKEDGSLVKIGRTIYVKD